MKQKSAPKRRLVGTSSEPRCHLLVEPAPVSVAFETKGKRNSLIPNAERRKLVDGVAGSDEFSEHLAEEEREGRGSAFHERRGRAKDPHRIVRRERGFGSIPSFPLHLADLVADEEGDEERPPE